MFACTCETRKRRYGRECAPAVGATVFARSDAENYVLIREHGGYGIHASRESFAEENHVRADAFVFYA